jgi:hypothetical protein
MPALQTEYDVVNPTSVRFFWDPAYNNFETVDAYQVKI